jgi:hypothetical protein
MEKSSYTEAQKKAIKKYNENNREKINELQRNRYKKKLMKTKEEQLKKEEELKNNILQELEEERKNLCSKCKCGIEYEAQKEIDINNWIDELNKKYTIYKKNV